MRQIKIGDLSFDCVTDPESNTKSEELFNLSEESRKNYGNLVIFRTSEKPRKFYAMYTTKKIQKKLLSSVIFSHYNNVDFISMHFNCVPLPFQDCFKEGLELSEWRFTNLAEVYVELRQLLNNVGNSRLLQPALNYFVHKIEFIILSANNQIGFRHKSIIGMNSLDIGEKIEILIE